jgi:hypothetical protein
MTVSEDWQSCHCVPNPARVPGDFGDKERTETLDRARGVRATWAPVLSSGRWEIKEYLFHPDMWADRSTCQDWVAQIQAKGVGDPEPRMQVECFETAFPSRETGAVPTDDEMALINQYALEPLAPEDVYVREMRLTNDRWGKHHVRLSPEFQHSVIATIPGKSLLLGHPEVKGMAAEPIGRFFDAHEWRDPDTGILWGLAKFYLVKTAHNEHARSQIDGGVWQYASIGMELDWRQCSVCGLDILDPGCPHIPGERYPTSAVKALDLEPEACPDDPGKVYCGITYRGAGTAVEGSIVYLPELNGTEIVAEVGAAVERVRAAEPEPRRRQRDREQLEALAGEEKVFRAAAVSELERLSRLLRREAELATYRDVAGEDLGLMRASRLLNLVSEWTQAWDESTPGGRQSRERESAGVGGAGAAACDPSKMRFI